ncbi:MAG: hypothetical protein ACR2QM_16730 [Longimicrobiales bacterium]
MGTGGTDQTVKSLCLLDAWSAIRTRSGLRFLLSIGTLTSAVGFLSTLMLFDYEAESSFIAVEPSSVAATGSLPSEHPLTPRAYADLAQSHQVLTQISSTHFELEGTFGARAVSGTLIELLGCEDPEPRMALACAVDEMSDRVEGWVHLASRAVHVRVRLDHPGLAEAVNARILELIGESERRRHGEMGESRREFSEGRLAVAHAELQGAEARLAGFRQVNRSGASSPALEVQLGRLTRETGRRAAIYTALHQSTEQERISELRATPLLWTLDPPEGSARPFRSPGWNALLGLVLGLVWASGVLAAQLWARQNASTPDYQRLMRTVGAGE